MSGEEWRVEKSHRRGHKLAEGQFEIVANKIRNGDVEMIQPRFMDMRIDGIEIR